jgi:hypothetical protein
MSKFKLAQAFSATLVAYDFFWAIHAPNARRSQRGPADNLAKHEWQDEEEGKVDYRQRLCCVQQFTLRGAGSKVSKTNPNSG